VGTKRQTHREYNHMRRHSDVGYKTPSEYADHCTCTKPGWIPIRPNQKERAGQIHAIWGRRHRIDGV